MYANLACELNNDENNDKQIAYNQFISQFEPNGVVDIALKTDKLLNV